MLGVSCVEVPHDDFRDLSREGVLSTGDVLPIFGDLDSWIVEPLHEIL